METAPSPRHILETLLPYLRTAGAYARQIQSRIVAQPDKDGPDGHFFASALSDADLSIQTMIEVVLLGLFPQVRFFGEEHAKTYNTKYFRAIDLGPQGDYLITLDPIDGTRYYLDGHNNFQVILGVLNADDYEAVIAITPAQDLYYYALRGQGTFKGPLSASLEECEPLRIDSPAPAICLGWRMGHLKDTLAQRYRVFHTRSSYSQTEQIPNFNGMLSGDLAGAIVARGQFIDGAALAFMAQEAGMVVTALDGTPLPPLSACEGMQRPGLVMAANAEVHQDLLAAIATADAGPLAEG